MIRNSVRRLTQAEAWEILFPHYKGSPEQAAGFPPKIGWVPGTLPPSPLPVDAEIAAHIKAGDILTGSNAIRRWAGCPYYITRLRIAQAAEKSAKSFETVSYRQNKIKPEIELVCKQTSIIVRNISEFQRRSKGIFDILMTGTSQLGEADDLDGLKKDSALASSIFLKLGELEMQLSELNDRMSERKRRIIPNNTPGDRWNQTFVFEMDMLCRLLTGKPVCKDSGLASAFISAAYSSLGGGETHAGTWASAVRTAHNKFKTLPEEEKKARIAGYRISDAQSQDINVKAMELAVEEQIARDVVAKALTFNDENSCIVATAIFELSSQTMRNYIEAIGWTADMRRQYPVPTKEG